MRRYEKRYVYTERTPDEKEKLIDQSLKLNKPKFKSRVYYTIIIVFAVLLMTLLGDFLPEVVIALIVIGVLALLALWISYAVKMRKYKKWYEEQFVYLKSLEQ